MKFESSIICIILLNYTTYFQSAQLESFAQQQDLEQVNKDGNDFEDQSNRQRSPVTKFLLLKGEKTEDDSDYKKTFEDIFERIMFEKPEGSKMQKEPSDMNTFPFPPPSFVLHPPPMVFPFTGAPMNNNNFFPFMKQPNMDNNQYYFEDTESDTDSDNDMQFSKPSFGSNSNSYWKPKLSPPSSMNGKKQKDRLKPKKPIEALKIVEIIPEAEPPGCSCNPFLMNSGWGVQKRCIKRCAAHHKQKHARHQDSSIQ